MMKKNSERNAAIRFMKKLFILFIPFIQPGYHPHRLLYHGKLLHYGLSMP